MVPRRNAAPRVDDTGSRRGEKLVANRGGRACQRTSGGKRRKAEREGRGKRSRPEITELPKMHPQMHTIVGLSEPSGRDPTLWSIEGKKSKCMLGSCAFRESNPGLVRSTDLASTYSTTRPKVLLSVSQPNSLTITTT